MCCGVKYEAERNYHGDFARFTQVDPKSVRPRSAPCQRMLCLTLSNYLFFKRKQYSLLILYCCLNIQSLVAIFDSFDSNACQLEVTVHQRLKFIILTHHISGLEMYFIEHKQEETGQNSLKVTVIRPHKSTSGVWASAMGFAHTFIWTRYAIS